MTAHLRTPLSRVEGLGAGKTGTTHFLHQRMTAVVLVPLGLWFVIAALQHVGASQADAAAFLGAPVNAVLMFLFLSCALYHMTLGLQVIIEDYVQGEALKLLFVIVERLAAFAIAASAGLALLRLALTGH